MFSGALCVLQHIPAICVWLPEVYIHFLPFLPNNVMFIMSFTSCCFKEGEKNLHKAVLWHCTTAVCAHRRVKSSGFAALGMMGRKTLLDTGLDHWRSHWHCLPCSPLLLFFFLSLKLLIRDCCNWLRLWELILVHKFWHWKPAKRLCGGGEWLHRIWCGVCLFSFLQPNTSTNPWADLDLYVGSICT